MHLLTGPISRIEFALGFFLLLIFVWLYLNADTVFLSAAAPIEYTLLLPAVFGIIAVLIQASIVIRRLDDLGYRRFFIAVYLLPPLYILALPFFLCMPGKSGVAGFRAKRFFGFAGKEDLESVVKESYHTQTPARWKLAVVFAVLLSVIFFGYLMRGGSQEQPLDTTLEQPEVDITSAVEGFTYLTSEPNVHVYIPREESITHTGDVEITYSEFEGAYKLYLEPNSWDTRFQGDDSIPFELHLYAPTAGIIGTQNIPIELIDDLCGFDCTTVTYDDSIFESVDAFNAREIRIPITFTVDFMLVRTKENSTEVVQKVVVGKDIARQ